MPVRIALSVETKGWPAHTKLRGIVRDSIGAAASEIGFAAKPLPELSLVFTDDDAIRVLNAQWRGKDKPTNVLSFPVTQWDGRGDPPPLLGDIVLARETMEREAREQAKPFEHHLAHLLVHGFLHLAGFDHETSREAEMMEAVERRALARLAIPDPYAVSHGDS